DDALVVLPGTGEEVANALGASANREVVRLCRPILERVVAQRVLLVLVDVRVPTEPLDQLAVRRDAPLGAELLRWVGQVVGASTYAEVELGGSLRSLLRDDLDHSRRGLGAVQRRRGRPLDDLDALDLVRVEVLEDAHLTTARAAVPEEGSRLRLVVHPNAVHVDQRLLVPLQARCAANPDRRAGADVARRAGEGEPRRLRF